MNKQEDRWTLTPESSSWPSLLNDLQDTPQLLYGMGDMSVLQEPCISVIGARLASPYGLAVAEFAGRIAAECGIVVVSGGAMGCDYAALKGALDAQGKIIIVAGTGANITYPNSSSPVFDAARLGKGAVVALERWDSPPRRHCFPKRNRIIAALSQCLMVCEASIPSGTFSTASTAADLQRTLYAVPGSIFSLNSKGTNALLEQGAQIIVDEVALETRISLDYGKLRLVTSDKTPDRGRLLSALVASPLLPQELAHHLQVTALDAIKMLADYESMGLVVRRPDGRFTPTQTALLHYGRK